MSWLDALHTWMLTPQALAAALLVATLAPAVAWWLARLLSPARARRALAALAVREATLVLLLLAVSLRFLDVAGVLPTGGPTGWLTVLGKPSGGWFASDVVILLSLAHAALLLVAAATRAVQGRTRDPSTWSSPDAGALPYVAWACGPLGLILAWPQLGSQASALAAADAMALMPVLLGSLAVGMFSGDTETAAPASPAEAQQADTPTEAIDVVAMWRALGAVSGAQPLEAAASVKQGGHAAASEAWHAAGGSGAPPEALDELALKVAVAGEGHLVGDLPTPTDDIFVAAAVILAAREHALRVLVVGSPTDGLQQRLSQALNGTPLQQVAGAIPLRDTLARGVLPDIVYLDTKELSEEVLHHLADPRVTTGRAWASSIGLVVLPRLDRGTPVVVTHRAMTFRRLHLALRRASARYSLLSTGFAGRGTLTLVRRAFPALHVREMPLKPRSTVSVTAWFANYTFFGKEATPWPRRAAAPILEAGHPVGIGDPTGAFGDEDVAVWGADVALDRGISLGGTASVSTLDDVWLVAAYRALPHRAAEPGAVPHHALWGLSTDPVTQFLVRNNNLRELWTRGQLPSPQPVVGHSNRSLGRAHLRAAIAEGTRDSGTLREAFGPSLVDEYIRSEGTDARHATRRDADGRAVRSPLVRQERAARGPIIRATVSDKILTLIDRDSSEALGEIDALTAPTRFYPRRVFAWGGRRYEVPLGAIDTPRGRLEVQSVDARQPLTTPRLKVSVRPLDLIQTPQRVRADRLQFTLASFDAIVEESVAGVWRTKRDYVTYQPTQCRYRTQLPGVFFATRTDPVTLHHLARSFEGVLRSHLLIAADDVEVVSSSAGWWDGLPAGLLVVDRHVQGMGLVHALDEAVVRSVLDWVYAILSTCDCERGCSRCTPWDVPKEQRDKAAVLRMLGG